MLFCRTFSATIVEINVQILYDVQRMVKRNRVRSFGKRVSVTTLNGTRYVVSKWRLHYSRNLSSLQCIGEY